MLKPGSTVELVMVACAKCLAQGRYELDTFEDYLEEKHIRDYHPELIVPDDYCPECEGPCQGHENPAVANHDKFVEGLSR